MQRVSAGLRLLLSPLHSLLEPARDLVARAQAACIDGQHGAVVRAFVDLHGLLLPPLDALIEKRSGRGSDGQLGSACVGLLGLWDELLDIDIERDDLIELLGQQAAQCLPPTEPLLPDGLAHHDGVATAQAAWLAAVLSDRALPTHKWWRRLGRRARGPLGDRARVTVFRKQSDGSVVRVHEHLPRPDSDEDLAATSQLGELNAGDQLTLAVQVPLPGQIAILHMVGDAQQARLHVVLPEAVSEAVVRRHLEVVELHGELACERLPDGAVADQALVVVWVPEVMPPSWIVDLQLRFGVPREARIWRYCYHVVDRFPPSVDAKIAADFPG